MAAIKVYIERDEQGQFSVGLDTGDANEDDQSMGKLMQPEGEHVMPDGKMMPGKMMGEGMTPEGQEDAGMTPAADLEDALNQARTLLAGPQTEQQAFASA
ncbi:MAG: hypothetical protein WC073_11320 [Sterolibacterium sp.]